MVMLYLLSGFADSPTWSFSEDVFADMVYYGEKENRQDENLANASEQLITVQDQIANMKEALFGKVVDSDKVESLYASHEGTEAAKESSRTTSSG